jgi:hypothetical protein
MQRDSGSRDHPHVIFDLVEEIRKAAYGLIGEGPLDHYVRPAQRDSRWSASEVGDRLTIQAVRR